MGKWGWTSYTKTAWRKDSGAFKEIPLYVGRFVTMPDKDGNFERCRIIFYSLHPIRSLRTIAASGDPLKFDGADMF